MPKFLSKKVVNMADEKMDRLLELSWAFWGIGREKRELTREEMVEFQQLNQELNEEPEPPSDPDDPPPLTDAGIKFLTAGAIAQYELHRLQKKFSPNSSP